LENERSQRLEAEKKNVQEAISKINKYLEDKYSLYYELVHKEAVEKVKEIEGKYEALKDKKQLVRRANEIGKAIKDTVKDNWPFDYDMLNEAREEGKKWRSEVRKEIYEEKLRNIISRRNIEETFIEIPVELSGKGKLVNMRKSIEGFLNSKKGEIYRKFLGKTIEKAYKAGSMVVFIAVFVTTCFLGHKFGEEIYKRIPENIKTTLKSGYGKIKLYVLLACVSFALMNIDDYQDFAKFLIRKEDESTLKDVAKVLLQTFLGCLIDGILLGMLVEGNNVILADEAVPYIANCLFGNNSWIFERILWPIIDTTIQVFGNGGPITYLAGMAIGTLITQILQQIIK